jgi:hypothetical protein
MSPEDSYAHPYIETPITPTKLPCQRQIVHLHINLSLESRTHWLKQMFVVIPRAIYVCADPVNLQTIVIKRQHKLAQRFRIVVIWF